MAAIPCCGVLLSGAGVGPVLLRVAVGTGVGGVAPKSDPGIVGITPGVASGVGDEAGGVIIGSEVGGCIGVIGCVVAEGASGVTVPGACIGSAGFIGWLVASGVVENIPVAGGGVAAVGIMGVDDNGAEEGTAAGSSAGVGGGFAGAAASVGSGVGEGILGAAGAGGSVVKGDEDGTPDARGSGSGGVTAVAWSVAAGVGDGSGFVEGVGIELSGAGGVVELIG